MDEGKTAKDFSLWFYSELKGGLKKLQSYITKNVYEDVNADLSRLEQLERILTNWQEQIKEVFAEDETERQLFNKIESRIEGALKILRLRIKGKERKPVKKRSEISTQVKALFCRCINDAGIIKKRESENLETYCKKVCEKYNLGHTTRVNKGFWSSENEGNLLLIKEKILPNLEDTTKKELSKYLEKKFNLSKEKRTIFA